MGRLIDEDDVIKAILQLDGLIYTIPDYIDAVRSVPSAETESRREWYMKGYRDAQAVSCTDLCVDCPLFDHEKHECPRFNRVIPRAIGEVKPSWIPVTERLPENNEEVLTTYIVNGNKNKRYTETATYYDDDEGDWLSPWDEYREAGARIEVIAWMPLPEPYKGGTR